MCTSEKTSINFDSNTLRDAIDALLEIAEDNDDDILRTFAALARAIPYYLRAQYEDPQEALFNPAGAMRAHVPVAT